MKRMKNSLSQLNQLFLVLLVMLLGFATSAFATPYTTSVPATGVALPDEYPEAGGIAIVLTGANGNIYYQFSDPDGAFRGFQNTGQPAAFRGNPFTINDPLTLDCGFASCSDYFGGSIARVDVRFSAYDGDTQPNGFDENDISLELNGFNVGSWSGLQTEITNNSGTQSFGFTTGFGNNTFNTAWFASTNTALLNNILTTGQTSTGVFDDDPNDNYWDFRRGPSLLAEDIRTIAPGYEFEKTIAGGATTFLEAGQVLTYEYEVRNIGSVDIDDITVVDDKIPNVMCPAPPNNSLPLTTSGSPAPTSLTCTGTYTVTQADVDAGVLTNVAIAEGTPEFGQLGAVSDTLTLTGPAQNNAIKLDKVAGVSSFSSVGEVITYTFTVTNTGNTTLTNVSVSDPKIPGLSCAIPSVLPLSAANSDNTEICTGTYTVTQADVDAYAINGVGLENTATVTGSAPDGSTPQDTASEAIKGVPAAPSLEIKKTANQPDYAVDGDVIDFQITVRNTGNVTWPGPPSINDPLTGGASCPAGPVAPGAQVICTTSYTVDQADVDAGSVTNKAEAVITVGGATASGTDDVKVGAVVKPGLSIVKKLQAGSPNPYDAVGQGLIYEYILTNDGNVTISGASVADDQIGVTCPATPIAPGASITCTSAPYVIDLADLDAGSVTNTARASGALPQGGSVSSADVMLTVPATQNPSLAMIKTAPNVPPASFVDGFSVTYTYDVTNDGNVTLAGPINVSDDKINGGTPFLCDAGPLAPGAAIQCDAVYVVTTADVTAKTVTNTAFAQSPAATSNTDNATIPQEGAPGITINKSAVTASFDAASDVLTFGFEIVNTGEVTIVAANNPITINDPGVTFAGCTQPALLYPLGSANSPQSYTCTGTFSGLTQADLDAGAFENTASASFPYVPPSGPAVIAQSSPSSVTIPADITPGLTLTKSSTSSYSNVGDIIAYTFEVTNTSNQSIAQVVVSDPLIPGLSCTLTNIPGMMSDSCTGTYAVDQADLDAGQVDNTATATGTTPQGVTITDTDDETVTINPAAQTRTLAMVKTASPMGFVNVGDVITYTLAVQNTGNLTATNIAITDPDLGLSCIIPSLAPTLTDSSCTGSRAVTQADIDAGSYTNTASVSADGIAASTAQETVNGPVRDDDWLFSKSADASYSNVGDLVRFTLRIENTGNVTLTNVVLDDPFFSPPLSCAIGDLLPGTVDTSCVGTYAVTQADIDAGSITNAATFAANGVAGAPVNDATDVTVPGPARVAGLDVVKAEEDANNAFALGVAEFYVFTVENTGNVTLTNAIFDDPLTGFTCALPDMQPGDVVTQCDDATPLRASYTPVQADIDAGSLTNVARVTADTPPGLPSITQTDELTLAGPVQLPLISMIKTATSGANFTDVGDVITYDYVVTNAGNITIDQEITIQDDKTTVSCPVPADVFAPGQTSTCTASYVVTQADLDAGEVVNIAEASVTQTVVPSPTHPTGSADLTTGQVSETVQADQLPELSIVKRVRPGTPTTFDAPGDLSDAANPNNIIFEFLVTNEGNVTTTAPITIADSVIPANITCTNAPVAPGDTVICSLTWAPGQAEVDAGSFTNSADASTVFDGATVTTPAPSDATVFAIQRPELTIVKSFVSITNNTYNVGATATYMYTVTNTGNTTIDNQVTVNDNLIGPITCGAPGIALGASVSCTATYVITQADFDLGSVTNSASATDGLVTSDPSAQTVPVGADPAIELAKVVSPASTATMAGDVISYVFSITNTSPGNGVVRPAVGPVFVIDDDKIGLITCNSGTPIAPDATFQCPAVDYTVTQADVDNVAAGGVDGFVTNNATASTTFGGSPVISPPVQVTVPLVATPSLLLTKTATNTTDASALADAGDILEFEIQVLNNGNQTISNLLVTDPMLTGLSCTGGGSDPMNLTLAPNAVLTCTGIYEVAQADLDGQSITNTANVEGSSQQGTIVSDDGSTTYPVAAPMPLLTVSKDLIIGAAPVAFSDVGETIQFLITVSNVGNITVNNIDVTDSLIPGTCSVATLAPGETDATCVFDYMVTQTDIDQGGINNTAMATGTPETGGSVSGSDVEVVAGPLQEPAIGVAKEGVGPLAAGTFDTEGQIISYLYTVANLGNVTLTETPVVTDNLIAAANITCDPMPVGGLLPSEELTCRADYVATQDDVDRGFVTNTAEVRMDNEYGGPELFGTIDATVQSERSVGMTIAKLASDMSDVQVNDVVTYTYTVTNTGNTRLFDVTLDDQHTSASGTAALAIPGSPIAVMQPDEVVVLTATYTVTQADIDAGAPLTNVVTATSTSPPGTTPPEATADEVVSLEMGDGMLEVIKTLPTLPAVLEPGVDLVFNVTVANTGNVTLTAPVLTDTVTQVGAIAPLPGNPLPMFIGGDTGAQAGLLDVGETWTYQVTYTLTQSDVDAGGISNSVVATSNDPSGDPVSDTSHDGAGGGDDPTVVPIASDGLLDVLKTLRSVPADPSPGDMLVFEVTVQNTGNVTLSSVVFDDNLTRNDGSLVTPDPLETLESGNSVDPSNLNVGETWIYRVEHMLTQADIDAGGVSNSVTVTTNDPSGGAVADISDNGAGTGGGDDPTVLQITRDPSIEVLKTVVGTVPAVPQPNDIVPFEVAVENTGNVTLTQPVLTDTLTPNGGSPIAPAPVPAYDRGDTDGDGKLSVGETWVYVLNYPITQVDIDAGGFANSVFAQADDPSGASVDDTSHDGPGVGSDPTEVVLNQNPALEAVKTILNAPLIAGDTVLFEITVQNSGNVTLSGVDIASDTLTRADGTVLTLASGPDYVSANQGSPAGMLMAGEIATYRATYVLQQADIDAGGIANTATATGTPPSGPAITDVSNDGAGAGDNPTELIIPSMPSLDMAKRLASGGPTFDAVGDVLTFEFDVTNSGNVTIGPISIVDPLITNAGGAIMCPPTLLAPGDMLTCSGDYSVIQADIDAGGVMNAANATDGVTSSDPDSVTVPALKLPALATDKDAVSITVGGVVYPGTPSERYVVGAIVAYDYTVTNTGNTTITAPITVSDNLIAAVSCPALPAGGLAPNASIVCEATYTVTSDDVQITSVTNLASATDGTTTSDLVSETVPANGVPALGITKDLITLTNPGGAVDAGLDYDEVGDVLTYEYVVTNTGEVSYAQPVNVVDDRLAAPLVCFAPDAANPDLIPGESVTCQATYTVTQDDLDAGRVTNTAFGETIFGDGRIVVSDPVMETADVIADPSVELRKSVATLPVTAVGQVLTYTLEAENTGNQTLTQVIVSDPLLPGLVCDAATLAPGAVLTCTEPYTVSQDDIDAGEVVNTAAVAAINPLGGAVTDDVMLVTDMPASAPGIALVKSASPVPFGAAGSTIEYRFAIENTGNVTLFDVRVTDAILTPAYTCDIARLDVGVTDSATCLFSYVVTQDDVDAGEILNMADVAANDPFGTPTTDDATLLTEGTAQAPRLSATKMAVVNGDGSAGSIIDFTLTLANTGNVTLAVTDIVDTMTRADGTLIALDAPFVFVGGDSNGDDRLGLTESWVYRANYTLTQADVDAGGLNNSATVNAAAPGGAPISDVSDDGIDDDGNTSDDVTEVVLDATPMLVATKTLRFVGTEAGDAVIFDIAVTNTGNVTLSDIALTDTMTNAAGTDVSAGLGAPVLLTTPMSANGLVPAETWTYELQYILTQADVDSGGLTNTALVSAQSPMGNTVDDITDSGDPADGPGDADPTRVMIEAAPRMNVTKTAGSPVRVGDGLFDITFRLAAENAGNITLNGVSMIDDLMAFAGDATLVSVRNLSGVGFTTGGANLGFDGRNDIETVAAGSTLTPGATGVVEFTVRLDVSEAGTDNDNVVSASTDEIAPNSLVLGVLSASATLDPLFEPNIDVTKTVAPSTAVVGDIVTYTIIVSNAGQSNEVALRVIDEMPSGLAFVPGSALVDGSATPAPTQSGRVLTWTGIDLVSGGQAVLTLQARVVDGGALTNRAYVQLVDGTLVSNVAAAVLQVRPEAVFNCGDVIGRVFDDRNMNGYQDGAYQLGGVTDQTYSGGKFDTAPQDQPNAEPGLAGVRVATVDGDVMTTDQYGRFSVPCAILPAGIGSNFVLKLDPSSLPTGYQVTSENPRMLRLTPGAMAQMNFGAALADVVEVTLTAQAFNGDAPSAALTQGVAQLVTMLDATPTILRLEYYTNGETRDTARARLDMVEAMIRDQWRSSGSGRDLIVERTIAEVQ